MKRFRDRQFEVLRQFHEPIPRPEEMKIKFTQDHYLIKTVSDGPEYQVWADNIRYGSYGSERTTFLETLHYEWMQRPSGDGWAPSASFRTLLEVRNDHILSIESIGQREVEVSCK